MNSTHCLSLRESMHFNAQENLNFSSYYSVVSHLRGHHIICLENWGISISK